MVNNDDPELSRKLQDVDGTKGEKLQTVTSNSFAIGRGGFGNVISNTKSHGSSTGSKNKLYAVVSNGEKRSKGKGFIHKLKGLFS